MVEFGLKLEDNKVSEWSDKYVRYEKLKGILKKCGHSLKRYDELASRRPEVAARVEEAYRNGVQVPTPSASRDNLSADVFSSSHGSLHSVTSESSKKEDSALMGDVSGSSQHGLKGYSSVGRALESAASGVSDYFQKSYERQVKDALKSTDKHEHEFERCLYEDIDNVNSFYKESMNETEGRLSLLKESVAHSFGHHRSAPARSGSSADSDNGENTAAHDAPLSDSLDDEYLRTPLVQNKKKAGPFAKTVERFSTMRRRSATGAQMEPYHHANTLPLTHYEDQEETKKADPEAAERIAREVDSIQRSLVDMYRRTKLLHNFAIINYTGFVKIVKKHDKTLPQLKGKYKKLIKPSKICDEGKDADMLCEHMERLYANWFCDRSISEARIQLLPKKGDGLETDWSQLRLGYRMGMGSVLGLWVCWDCVWGMLSAGTSTIGGRTAFPVFRACGGLLFLQWCWGCSCYVWGRYRVNYIFLFDFNPNTVSSPLSIINEAVDNSLVFLLMMLLYYKAGAHDVPGNFPAGIFPAALIAFALYKLVFPLNVRGPMWMSIWRVVTAPMTSPTFFHGYIGDIFTSMVKVFQDMAWALCFLGSGDWLISEDVPASTRHTWSKTIWYSKYVIPIITLLPLWFRFNQCLRKYADTGNRWPHLFNAFKYALSMTVTLFGAFHPLYLSRYGEAGLFQLFWMVTFITSSGYSFAWDLFVDWGLGRPKYHYLGPRLMYPKRIYYYAIIWIDLVLRFAWVLTLVPPNSGANFALPQYLTAASMVLELFRRTIWGFLRLENEHRSNTSGYRRVGFVPLHFRTEHSHGYKQQEQHRGVSVLIEVAIVTLAVLGAAVASVVAAQKETERLSHEMGSL